MIEVDNLVSTTADIVAAHFSNNLVAVGDVGALICNVHSALAGLGSVPAIVKPAKRGPIVSVRNSVKPEAISCLICGAAKKMLKRHLTDAHGLTPQAYRTEFGLRDDYPMTAANHTEVRRVLAKANGLGTKAMWASVADRAAAAAAVKRPRGRPPRQAATA